MLTGIKTGKKKKKKKKTNTPSQDGTINDDNNSNNHQKKSPPAPAVVAATTASVSLSSATTSRNNNNASVAGQLCQSLAAGIEPSSSVVAATASAYSDNHPTYYNHEQQHQHEESNTDTVVLMDPPVNNKNESDMTVQELLVQEKYSSSMSQQEQEARNVIRMGKKRKIKLQTLQNADSDEEEARQMQYSMPRKKNDDDYAKADRRNRSRQIAIHDKQEKIVDQCWWWIESSSRFAQQQMLTMGKCITLCMAPPSHALIYGKHLYIVPIPHAPSYTAVDDDVWSELRTCQLTLRNMVQSDSSNKDKGILFFETVLPSKGFWQTRMEAVIVPKHVEQDAPLYFRNALNEQAEEWGTHQKLMVVDVNKKDLRHSIPRNFSYFYVEFPNNTAYVQMIENRNFPKDFGIDTIGGMMQMDPIRFRRRGNKKLNNEQEERNVMSKFMERWKPYDWTVVSSKQQQQQQQQQQQHG